MSSYVEMEPVAHATKTTPYVRIDNDFGITVVINDNGTLTTHYYNLQGIPDEFNYFPSPADDVLIEARIAKEGTDESIVFRVNMFYDDNDDTLEDWQIPHAWIYSAVIDKDNYLPGTLPDSVNQVFPIVLWNQLTPQQTAPGANTVSATIFDRRYALFGSLAKRRNEIKRLILAQLRHPNYPQWLAGGTLSPRDDTDVNLLLTHVQSLQNLSYYPEMLTRAISVDANLNSERKFNLLHGMASLNLGELISNSTTRLLPHSLVNNSDSRNNWAFQRIGAAAATSPFAYTRTDWTYAADTSIVMTGSASIGDDWQAWLQTVEE